MCFIRCFSRYTYTYIHIVSGIIDILANGDCRVPTSAQSGKTRRQNVKTKGKFHPNDKCYSLIAGPQNRQIRLSFYYILQDGCDGITVDDLKDQLQRHEGLLENLTISIGEYTRQCNHQYK